MIRFPSAQRVEANGLGVEIQLAADQAMGPAGIHLEGTTEETDSAGLRGATEEDHQPVGSGLQIRLPRGRERPSGGSGPDASGGALAVGVDIPLGAFLEVGERIMVEACPNLGLPPAVEVFDGGLEPAFVRWHEHGHDVESQARPYDATEDILPAVATSENHVVVELRVGRPPKLLPVLQECLHRGSRRHEWLRPSTGQPALQGNDVEDLEADAPFECQTLDNVEAVEFGPTCRQLGEVPTLRRRRAADPAPGIKCSSSLKDAADRPHRRYQRLASSHERAVEGPGSILAQITRLLQFASHADHEVLDRRFGPMDRPRDRRSIAPIDAVQGQIPGTSAPPLHGGEAHPMGPGHRSHRRAGPDLRDHRAPLLLPTSKCFLPIASYPQRFSPSIVTERCWHLSDREVVALGP